MTKKIMIIGAGIAGLSAGIHACRNGYEVTIYEKHHLPGGLCTSWERNGFIFDGCIHWLVGSGSGSQFNRLWREVCPINEMEIINHDKFMTVEGSVGERVNIYNNMDKLESHLLEFFPDDELVIKEITGAARKMSRLEFPLDKPDELMKAWDMVPMLFRMLPLFKIMGRFSRISIEEYISRIKSPFLRDALSQIMPSGYSMLAVISTLASHHAGDAGFPQGGSLRFARALETSFLEAGGVINYNNPVNEILVEEDFAVGLRMEDGTVVRGNLIISAADLYHSVYELLRGRYNSPLIKESFKSLPTYTSVQISFGIDSDLSGEENKVAVRLANPINLGGVFNEYLYLTNYSFDPTLAPEGKSVVTATLSSGYDYWAGSVKNRELYRERKNELVEKVVPELNKRFPATKNNIKVVDVTTPYSYYRYTNVYKGAYMSWIVPPDAGRFKIPARLPGLSNYYQVGQWTNPPAGLPGAMLSGRQVIQVICNNDKKQFRK
jgi:phytoene dehydrogenase-like protein